MRLTVSLPILFFQAAIALSILAAGYRYRTMAAACWALFTLAMVYVYWLSLIQFGTIAVAWHYAGAASGTTHYKTLQVRYRRLRKGRFGYLKLHCMQCRGCRCRGATFKTGGAWPLLRVAPSNARLLEQRAGLVLDLENEARRLEARQPNHRFVGRMKYKAERLRVAPEPKLDGREREKFLWIDERAQNLQSKFVQRLTFIDILPCITVLSVPVMIVALYISSAGYYDKQDAKLLGAIASVTMLSYLLQAFVGLYWLLRRRLLMPHLFTPGGGFLSLRQPV